jgi:hypothetical protein
MLPQALKNMNSFPYITPDILDNKLRHINISCQLSCFHDNILDGLDLFRFLQELDQYFRDVP